MRSTVSVMVLIASLAALALVIHGQYGSHFPGNRGAAVFSGAVEPAVEEDGEAVRSGKVENGGYRALAEFLARRYKVSQDVTFDLVSIAHAAGQRVGLDPLLIIAVMSVESRFNPIAESVAGAKGLMQIIPKYHPEKFEEFGGEKAVFDPAANILVGSRILKEYIGRTGNLSTALQMYAGALNDEQDVYTSKVLSEKQRLQQILSRFGGHPLRVKATAVKDLLSESSPL
ncbi:MAG: transglycosylase SLT domain-containing protein [Burkholderiales bacterium]